MPTNQFTIKGKVQGVFYRVSAQRKAKALGVAGWVKNTPEGNVEILAAGTEEALQHFLEWCRQGPPGAVVTQVLVHRMATEQSFDKFEILK